MTESTLAPGRTLTPDDLEQIDVARPWNVVVWDDPVNTTFYVTYVFRKVFGYGKLKATRLMLQVHNEGRCIVSTGPLEMAEIDVAAMHHHGLWATLEQA